MDDGSRILWIVILAFFCFAAYFAVAETSFASVSKIRIKTAMERGNKRASKTLKVLDEFDCAVTTILIGTNITHLGIASLVTVIVIRNWGTAYVPASTLITTVLVFFLSEMLPKSIAKRFCEPLALFTAASLLFFMKIFYPISSVLTAIGQAAARRIGQSEEVSVTEEELYDIIEDMTNDGVLDEDQGELMNSALDFGDLTLDNILTSREEIQAIEVHMSPAEIIAFLLKHHYNRYPVYDGSIDHIIGTLQMRKYLKAYRKSKNPDLRSLIDPPFFVRSQDWVDDLIENMSKKKNSLAIVLDEQNHTRGMVTIADALQELIQNEKGGDAV